jgi:hypothetical protein
MADFEQRISIEGLRHISARLSRGEIVLHRIDGDTMLIEADGALECTREGDALMVGLSHLNPFQQRPRDAASSRRRFVTGLGDLGEFIDDVVTRSFDSIFSGEFLPGGGNADVRIGIPAVLENPVLEAVTHHGDIRLEGIHAQTMLRTGSGDIRVREAGGSLEVSSGMGDVEIKAVTGRVSATTGSGDISLDACLEGGLVHTGSGDVNGRGLGGVWRLHSGSGDIQVQVAGDASLDIATGAGDVSVTGGATRRLQLQSGSGDLTIKSVLLGERHQLSTGNGDITLGIADPPGARLQIITRSGSVRSDYPLVMVGKQGPQTRGSARFVGNIGDSSVDVEVRTGSGDVHVIRLDSGPFYQAGAASSTAGASYAAASRPEAPSRDPNTSPAPVFEAETGSGSEETVAGDDWAVPTPAPVPAPATTGGDPRLRILESLKNGEISVEEASMLIGALETGNA